MEASGEPVQPEEVSREREAWKRRPFARSLDLIAAQYGWTDDQILDLTMQRMAQIRQVIWERQAEDRRKELSVREVELRTLASYIAASAGNKAGMEAAKRITLQPPETDASGKPRPKALKYIPYGRAKRMFGG